MNSAFHLQRFGDRCIQLPSVAGIAHGPPSVVVDGGYVLLPAMVACRRVLLSTSAGGGHSLLTVSVGDRYVLLPAVIVDGCVLLSALGGGSFFCPE